MKLPFVSRAHADLQDHNLGKMRSANHVLQRANDRLRGERDEARSQVASWKALFDAERIRCEGLTEKLLQMKQQGFSTAVQRQAEPVKEPSRIEATIAERAGTNSALRRHLTRWATQRQEMRVPEDEIVDALTHWKTAEDDAAA